jgi:hypothetical protein
MRFSLSALLFDLAEVTCIYGIPDFHVESSIIHPDVHIILTNEIHFLKVNYKLRKKTRVSAIEDAERTHCQ